MDLIYPYEPAGEKSEDAIMVFSQEPKVKDEGSQSVKFNGRQYIADHRLDFKRLQDTTSACYLFSKRPDPKNLEAAMERQNK